MSAAVVPCWGGVPLADKDRPFLDRVRAEYANIQLHGYEHFRPGRGGLVSKIADGKDEMNGLDPVETDRRLAAGQEILERWMGKPATGFIAPNVQSRVRNSRPTGKIRHSLYRGIWSGSDVNRPATAVVNLGLGRFTNSPAVPCGIQVGRTSIPVPKARSALRRPASS